MFQNGIVSAWLFSDSENKILRKKKNSLNFESIREIFLKNVSKSGIVASFYFLKEDEKSIYY